MLHPLSCRPEGAEEVGVLTIEHINTIPKLPPRPADAHKGQFGRVLVIGGSRGMIGAPALVANAALRSGAGLATVACPKSIQTAVATLCPCATTIPLKEIGTGLIDGREAPEPLASSGAINPGNGMTVIAAGPGLGTGRAAFNNNWKHLLRRLDQTEFPVVLDADALNAIAPLDDEMINNLGSLFRRSILTPHPGEMARLCDVETPDIQKNRESFAVDLARRLSIHSAENLENDRPVVVLKGAETLVTDRRRIYTNQTGNPGMATGGSGDVLTGIVAALVAQGLPRFEAAILAVHLHGRAGDLAAERFGLISLIATDLIDALPVVFQQNKD